MIFKKILKMILIMKKFEVLTTPLQSGAPRRQKFAFSLKQYRRLETGEISRATYMKSMGLKFSARTDL